MMAYENVATHDDVLTADQLKRLARHRYSCVGQTLLEPYMQVFAQLMIVVLGSFRFIPLHLL